MERIKENIFVETEFVGCNPGFVVTKEGVVMIDTPQRPDEAFRWRKEIQKYGEISYIIAGDTIPLNDNLAVPEGQLPIPACGRAMAPFDPGVIWK